MLAETLWKEKSNPCSEYTCIPATVKIDPSKIKEVHCGPLVTKWLAGLLKE